MSTIPRGRSLARLAAIVAGSLLVISLAVAFLEGAGLHDGSSLYLLAVVVTGVLAGVRPALLTATGAFLVYDLFFVEPRFTLSVEDPQEWLNLLLLLIVGIVVARLAGLERDRAVTAEAREREAVAMSRISFALATTPTASAAVERILAVLLEVSDVRRAWIDFGERTVADTGSGPRPTSAAQVQLRRAPGDRPPEWVRVHVPAASGIRPRGEHGTIHRIAIAAGEQPFGTLWFERERSAGPPGPGLTRLAAAAADQIARSMDRDRLAAEAAAAEIGRRSDALKSALLDSVSHDLRTPLASIRAAAGSLMDGRSEHDDEQRQRMAAAIDAEAARLGRLVSNLLDLSRIEAGGLRPTTAAFVLEDLVRSVISRSPLCGQPRVRVAIPADLPLVEVDEVLFDQVLGNLLENVDRYAGRDVEVQVAARREAGSIVLTVEDAGPGVNEASLERLFEKFYRVPRAGAGSRRGTGTGLAVVAGLARAMGGSVAARRSLLGGLAIDVTLRPAPGPVPEGIETTELVDGP